MDASEEIALRRHVEVARSRLTRPALALMLTALFQALTSVMYLVLALVGLGAVLAWVPTAGVNGGAEVAVLAGLVLVLVLVTGVGLLPPLIVIYGALQMRRMRSYGWAIGASVLLPSWSVLQLLTAMLFTNIFGVLQLPQFLVSCTVGIWAFVVLQDLRIYRAYLDAHELGMDH
ncbi:MAG: hypothetical protein ACI9MC_001997 [Kiritimatiellia bacterium]|jgi:hypothetical protein